jgi:pimeloyl-ACP methyl ester carboxylesterase
VVVAALAPLAGVLAWSRWGVRHDANPPSAIDAERRQTQSAAGRVTYYADDSGSGRPLLLIHGAHIGASTYALRPLFEYFRGRRPVYAMDLPGYGRSERSARVYAPATFAEAILDMLWAISEVAQGGADVVALGLGSEFAARATTLRPESVHSLALISPTGMASRMEGGWRGLRLYRALAFPLWAQAAFDLLATRLGIALALAPRFTHEPVAGMLEYAYANAHTPGSRHAALYATSGRLRTPNAIDQLYARGTCPALVIYDRDPFTRFDAMSQLIAEPASWRATPIRPTRGVPQFDRLGETAGELTAFWGAPVGAQR